MSWIAGILLVWRHACSQALRGRRGLALAALAALPVLVALLQVRAGHGVRFSHFMGTVVVGTYQFVVPFTALFLGVAVLGDEIEGRTITYLFTRPLPRQGYFLGRYLGYATAAVLLLSASLLACGLLFRTRIELSGREIAGTLAIAAGGLLTMLAFMAALRAFFDRALFAGFLLGFIFEGMVSKMPAKSGLSQVSIWHHLALLQIHLMGPRALQHVEFAPGISPDETVRGSLIALATVLVVCLLLGMWRVRAREIRIPAAVG